MTTMQNILDNLRGPEIAVVGMAGRFPGAPDVETFWRNLRDGVEARTAFTDDDLRAAGVDEAMLRSPHYVKSGMVLEDMEQFDPGFFGFSPRDAAIMDPQHRHFLEVAWQALEHAGYDPQRFDGSIGVFGGSGMNAYMPYNLFTNPELMQELGLFLVRHTGNDKDFLTTRVSYLFDLKGPSINVQTACSTSLVAIHLACQSLVNFECDMALAGGVTIELPHRQGYIYHEGEILSPDGHCRAFDAQSQGTVFGSGAGVVTLKRLEDAIQDGDTIHAIIQGSAVNNDGSSKMNYFAPSVDGQSAAIAEALAVADVTADSLSYVEAHGTGTPLGDPIEVEALTKAFRATTDKRGYCGIGSVKTNIGHLDTAAGVASFIKVVQALRHGQLPPSLNFEQPNPVIDFASSPFYVNSALADWPSNGQPRRAGVSSLGVGGTNAHIVLEEAPPLPPTSPSRDWQVWTLAAKTPNALDRMAGNLADYLEQHPDTNLADAAYTLQVGRQGFAYRRVVVSSGHEGAVAALRGAGEVKPVANGQARQTAPQVAFMFPGGGAQYPNMGRDLYEREPVYREVIDRYLPLAQQELGYDLRPYLYPDETNTEAAADKLREPLAGLVALFITEYAAAQWWQSLGIEPAALIGHSLGEYCAACVAGVMSPEDALSIVAERGRLFESLPGGAMLSVPLPEAEVLPLLVEGVSVAVVNNPTSCVVSGSDAAIENMAAVLDAQGINHQRVKIAVAAHSPMLDPILETFRQHVQRVQLSPPTIPFISNLTGSWVDPTEAATADYWVRHLRHTVRFADGIATLMHAGDYVLVEVGPGTTLGSLARDHNARPKDQIVLASLRHPRESVNDVAFALRNLGQLWLAGLPLDWGAFYGDESRRRIPLPTYPFEHQRCWIEPGAGLMVAANGGQGGIRKLENMNDWFYKPVWKPRASDADPAAEPLRWLVFLDGPGLGRTLVQALEQAGHDVVTVEEDRQYRQINDRAYTVSPRMREDYFELVAGLNENGGLPQRIVHLWGVGEKPDSYSPVEFYEKNRDNLFYSLLFLTQALAQDNLPHPIEIGVVSSGMQSVAGEPLRHPEKAILLGPCRVIPHEYADLTCRSVDVVLPAANTLDRLMRRTPAAMSAVAQQLVAEFSGSSDDVVIAYRDGQRYVKDYEPARLTRTETRLRDGGVYLITGGLGGIGLTLADDLARTHKARLILLGRSGLPAREEWDHWLRTQPTTNRISQQIQAVREMEAAGAEVLVLAADVSNRKQLKVALDTALAHFGTINGVLHAAGKIDDNLMQLKTAGDVERVLAPKVRGALLLDELLADIDLDFVLLFSSTSTILGAVGQADYTAANAFLDAFAHHRRGHKTTTISLNWGMWQEVGMAVNAAEHDRFRTNEIAAARPGHHPLLEYRISSTPDEVTYASHYRTDLHWILDQHRLKDGTALLPGTGYLELARAAVDDNAAPHAVAINDLTFLSPLQVADGKSQEVQVRLTANNQGYYFAVVSRAHTDDDWQDHARGKVTLLDDAPPRLPYPLAAIAARCNRDRITYAPGEQFTRQEEHLRFGQRWKVLREVSYGDGEALARLELPDDFTGELDTYRLHPALLDLATGFGLPLTPGYDDQPDLYVPLAYGRVRVLAPLPARIYSHARYTGQQHDITRFDVTLVDEQGQVLVEIEDFVMKRTAASQLVSNNRTGAITTSEQPTLLDVGMIAGIRPDEGVQVLQRVLSSASAPQVVATSLDLDTLADLIDDSADVPPAAQKFARPAVATEYIAPRDELETRLAVLWQDALGIDMIGVNDDFFDLGGQSLIAMRLFAQIKRVFAVDLSLSTLFNAPTVAQLAEILGETVDVSTEAKILVPIKTDGKRPPLFCIHDLNGHVLYYRDLAKYVAEDQPLYGLQAHGLNEGDDFDETIDAMATRYIEAMCTVQPHGPYYLAGSSLGGLVAFDMAQKLRALGEEVALLAVFDSWTPAYLKYSLDNVYPPESLVQRVYRHARSLLTDGLDKYLEERLQNRKNWDKYQRQLQYRDELRNRVQAHLANGTPMPNYVRNFYREEVYGNAYQQYEPAYYPGKMTLFVAEERLYNDYDPQLGWTEALVAEIETLKTPGQHGFMVREPYVAQLAEKLQDLIDREQARSPQPG